jgi:hypothetical protein
MQSPSGSNDRLNEENTNRNNAERLFDSQNNAKGGYCWGPTMTYYESSILQIEWTNQHGCGQGHTNVDCEVIVQYMCHPAIRDGTTTTTITQATMNDKDASGNFLYGMHETYPNYRKCQSRLRNEGVFAADQGNLDNNAPATRTRQDNAGTQYGFECPEERDYYPYWHPTPWKDIVVFTANPARCDFFRIHSQNVEDKWWCESDATDSANVERFNNPKSCEQRYWVKVEAWNIEPPKCYAAGFNKDNHLGNGVGGFSNTYKWVLPSMGEIKPDNWIQDPRDGKELQKVAPCVLRIRYNISSGDYRGGVENLGQSYAQGGFVDSTFNGRDLSPVTQDPYVEYGKPYGSNDQPWHLVLAIDTSQFARTFQDRSHMFYITHQPIGHIGPIYNLGVRGKRGNIVQTYPAVEYDFTPNDMKINLGDFIHFQWTGCETNPQGNDGEGINGRDRSNFVVLKESELGNGRTNYPKKFDVVDIWGDTGSKYAQDLTFKMAYINQYNGVQCQSQDQQMCCLTLAQLNAKHAGDNNGRAQDPQNCAVLNAVGANYFDGGLVKMIKAGVFNYMSTRNNNFTNRSQKGTITVTTALSPVALTATIVGCAGFAGAAVIGGGSWYASTHPESSVANCFSNVKA